MIPVQATSDSAIIINHYKRDNEEYDQVSNLAGCYSWAECLDCEIVLEEDVNLTEKQVLALCLWDRTYYGFSPEQEGEEVDSWEDPIHDETTHPHNPYFRKLVQLARRRYRRKVRVKDRSYDSWGLPLWPAKYIIGHRNKLSSRDRKAELRYRKNRKYLSHMSEAAETIRDVISKYPSLNENDLKFMMESDGYARNCFKSQVKNLDAAVQYIIESLMMYSDLPKCDVDSRVIVLLCLPLEYKLSDTDKVLIETSIEKKIGKQPDIFTERNTSDTHNLRLTIIQSIKSCK
jgi:hypothetical protein